MNRAQIPEILQGLSLKAADFGTPRQPICVGWLGRERI
jgi:hypothetical protein